MATTTGASRSFPTLRYLAVPFRWVFGSRRRFLIGSAVLLAIFAAPRLWWSLQLVGLPDIGDPFDVAAFRSFTIPDDRNACVLYRQAADRLKPLIASSEEHRQKIDLSAHWSEADPAARRWVEENREAMAIYRRGTERPDALDPALSSNPDPYSKVARVFRSFHSLLLLEASRLEERGDRAGAWGWFHAALRATHHMGLRGTTITRLIAQSRHSEFRRRFAAWAADPRTTPALIRQALDDVVACKLLAPSESYTLAAEYSYLEGLLDSPDNPARQEILARVGRILEWLGYQRDSDVRRAIDDAWRTWRRESERSHRVLRLAIANWLAYHDRPPERRPAPDPGISGPYAFYTLGPEAPAKARSLSPEALTRWLNTTSDAKELLRIWDFRAPRVRERANHRVLVILLASELYRREHGTEPPSDEALVGPDLKELPYDVLGYLAPSATSKAGEAPGAPGSPGREK
jgi:hypothetical protein